MKMAMTVLLLIERAVIYTLSFTQNLLVRSNANSKVIKEVQDDLYTDINKPPVNKRERIIVTPIQQMLTQMMILDSHSNIEF